MSERAGTWRVLGGCCGKNLVVACNMNVCTQELACCGIYEVAGFHHHMKHVCLIKPIV